MRAGALRHTLVIEQPTETQDAHGQAVQTWSTFATVPGELRPVRARELVAAAQVVGELTAVARIRYLAGITEKMRVKFGDRIFAIVGPPINLLERNAEVELLLAEGVSVA